MNLIACINCFNSMKTIPKTINSICDIVDKIVVIDSAYEDFPHKEPYSTDGTVEYLKSLNLNIEIIETRKAWKDQIVKRTQYFLGKKGDFYFLIDADEILMTSLEKSDIPYISNSKQLVDVGWGGVLSKSYKDKLYFVPRILKHQNGMHYAGRHYWIYDGQNHLIVSHRHKGEKYTHADMDIIIRNIRPMARGKSTYRARRHLQEIRYKDENAVYGKETRLIPHPKRAPVI